MDCKECLCDPSLKETWGCDTPTQHAVWETEEDVFYNCPLRWLNDQIITWYEEYAYYKELQGSAPAVGDLVPGWLECMQYYNSMQKYFFDVMNPKKGKDSTSSGLSVLRQSFMNREKYG